MKPAFLNSLKHFFIDTFFSLLEPHLNSIMSITQMTIFPSI